MDLEFLNAMLARDEAPTWTLSPYACEPGCCAPEGWVGAQCRYCDSSPVYGGTVEAMTSSAEEHAETIHQRSRMLREVEAKRRIITRAGLVLDSWDRRSEAGQSEAASYPDVTRRESSFWRATLADMAAVYADHDPELKL